MKFLRTFAGVPSLLGSGCRLAVVSFHRKYSLISLRKSTPPQNRQLNILISNSEQCVDDFVGGLTF